MNDGRAYDNLYAPIQMGRYGGAGSGGSIYIATQIWTGSVSGVLTAIGGSTTVGSGGAGAGGLITIHMADSAYAGVMMTYGGQSDPNTGCWGWSCCILYISADRFV